MKIYIASSWKNSELCNDWAQMLRVVYRQDVDCFCDDNDENRSFNVRELTNNEELNVKTFLENDLVKKTFMINKKWIDWCDVVLLILPAGNSAHLEAGYAKGLNKKLIIWKEEFEPGVYDVMYGFADLITDKIQEVIQFLEDL